VTDSQKKNLEDIIIAQGIAKLRQQFKPRKYQFLVSNLA
jgi:hypothetical protein